MEVQTQVDIAHAFVATSEDISTLWEILKDDNLTVTATASCADGLVRHFDNCESLVQYNNPTRAAITSLEISARSYRPYTAADISLGARYSAPISISLRGEENLVSSMRTNIFDKIDGMRSWYSNLSTMKIFYVWIFIFMFLFLLTQIMIPSGTPNPATPLKKAIGIIIAMAVVGSISAVIFAADGLRKRLFPVATFAVGQGLSRHQHNEQIRWVVIVGFVVALCASIVTTILLA